MNGTLILERVCTLWAVEIANKLYFGVRGLRALTPLKKRVILASLPISSKDIRDRAALTVLRDEYEFVLSKDFERKDMISVIDAKKT
ncbi:hypothetical protein KQX54_007213 [Cotesia glomerata]|uniref:Uncharacterized protein n=1 Tax=Cotesia glomerata TaxID=32391 RepID=A0AAV7IKD5_COTGL|nr:hypothetical protein KQX54_007213 [Cotesia glomerata]